VVEPVNEEKFCEYGKDCAAGFVCPSAVPIIKQNAAAKKVPVLLITPPAIVLKPDQAINKSTDSHFDSGSKQARNAQDSGAMARHSYAAAIAFYGNDSA